MSLSSEPLKNTSVDIAKSWQLIIDITQSMKKSAIDEDWLAVSSLSTQRHSDIEKHFQRYPVGPQTADFYHRHLSQFLANEDAITRLANDARKLAIKSNLKLVSNKKAVNSYKDING